METTSGITEEQVKAGYRLNHAELKQASNWFKDRYIEIVSRQLIGLRTDDLAHFSVAQEKAYRSVRTLCFSRKIETYMTAEIFYQLTDLDQRICVQCMASLGEQLPVFLKNNQRNRYWYNFWYAQAHKEQIRTRTKDYLNSLPEDVRVKKRRDKMRSTRNYLQTEKGKARTNEYRRNYYRRKQAELGKEVGLNKNRRTNRSIAKKSLWARLHNFLNAVNRLLFN